MCVVGCLLCAILLIYIRRVLCVVRGLLFVVCLVVERCRRSLWFVVVCFVVWSCLIGFVCLLLLG